MCLSTDDGGAPSMPEAVRSLTAKEPLQGAEPERADSKVLSDEEVEEAEASDSFPALGYPAGIGSIGSGKVLTGPVAALRRFPPWPARLGNCHGSCCCGVVLARGTCSAGACPPCSSCAGMCQGHLAYGVPQVARQTAVSAAQVTSLR